MTPELIVERFFKEVRSGRNIHLASELMSEKVLAHQIQSEHEITIERSPIDYANHVQEMLDIYGAFTLEVQELFASQQDKVYVRRKQVGTHIGEVDGFQSTGVPIIQLASTVYQVKDDKITEYWIQIDRAGIQSQLESNKKMNIK